MSAPTTGKPGKHHRAVIADRSPAGDHADAEQARRALARARTEHAIRTAIENAPPLDADTLARIRALLPAVPAGGAA